MSKKTTNVKKPASKKPKAAPGPGPAAPVAIEATPAPDALAVVPVYDKKAKHWDACIREGKTEHAVLEDRFETDDDAKAGGAKWIASYAKAKDAGRRKMLGWKAVPAAGKGASATDATGATTLAQDTALEPAATNAATATKAATGAKPAKRKAKPKTERKASGLDVAAQMLKDAGTPMKCKEMVEQMLAKGLWQTNGKTPAATIYAAIIREIAEKGKQSRFTKTDRGMFAFNAASEIRD